MSGKPKLFTGRAWVGIPLDVIESDAALETETRS